MREKLIESIPKGQTIVDDETLITKNSKKENTIHVL